MKKLCNLLLCFTLILALAGCGKEQSATYVMTSEPEGMFTMVDEQTLKATGDIVYELTEVTTLDFTNTDTETRDLLIAYYDETMAAMQEAAPEGVTVEFSAGDNSYTIKFSMDLKNGDLQEMIDGGYLMALEEDSSSIKSISFKQTVAGLEEAGYTLKTE